MRKLQYKVMTPKGFCTVNTLPRAKEIIAIYGGHYETLLTKVEKEETEEEKQKREAYIKLKMQKIRERKLQNRG